tara:strand:+ start:924 stop:1118 length:195 start_codon:yes stop_codon:yes gene_type:complete
MSKKEDKIQEESVNIASNNSDHIEALAVQLKDYREKADYFKTMALKAEGAIEVLTQLNNKGVTE